MQILTSVGFRDCDSVEITSRKRVINVVFADGRTLSGSFDHMVLSDDEWTPLCALSLGDIIDDSEVCDIYESDEEDLYDAINVAETASYLTDGFVSHNCIYLDEFAFVDNAEEFFQSTYPVVTSGKKTKVIITSTPNGAGNLFHKMWESATQGISEFKAFRIYWNDVPGRDDDFKRKTIANTSDRQWRQEFECEFHGSSNTLLEADCLLALRASSPLAEDFDKSFKVYSKAVKGRVYIMSVDPSKGRGKDYHVINVIDVSADKFRQVAIYRNNELSPLLLPDIIKKIGMLYNQAYAVIEANNGGDAIASTLAYELEYENVYRENGRAGFLQTGKTKRHGCSNLKDLIEEGKIEIVDAQTIKELSEFVISGDSYAASGKNNDDCVMSLVNFAYFIQTSAFSDMTDINLRDLLYSKRIKEISAEEDNGAPPAGFFDNGLDRRSMNAAQTEETWF